MQVIKLSLDHWNFYCPVTGEKIAGDGEELNEPASLKGVWIQECIEEPYIIDPQLQSAWEAFYDHLTKDDNYDYDYSAIDQFFQDYPEPNWLAFKITAGTAFFNDTGWFIIDMNTESE